MFKRVEKRRRKKQEEEELGLDEDMKEVLGIHDTDSEESASDSDGSSEDEGESEEGSDEEAGEDIEEHDEEHDDGEESGDEDEESGDEDEDEDPNITVSQALVDSIYVVSVLPEVKACIVCPGKLLKGAKMVQLHRVSNAHERRLKQFKTFSVDSDPSESAWEVLRQHSEEKPKLSLTPSTTSASKRAEKKKAKQARRKVKREKFKVRQAKKAIVASTSSTEKITKDGDEIPAKSRVKKSTIGDSSEATSTSPDSPPKKKRKVDSSTKSTTSQTLTPSTKSIPVSGDATPKPKRPKHRIPNFDPSAPPVIAANPTKSKESVMAIVRSTSDRAKNARSRAVSMSGGVGRGRGSTGGGGRGRGSSNGGGRGRGGGRGGRGGRGRS